MSDQRTEGIRHRIEDRFQNSGLVLLLLHSFWFSLFFFGFIAFVIFLGLFLPKWWVQTPEGFDPVVKVSGLDKVQAWSLSRSARKREAEGKIDEAILTWRMAAGNNLANPEPIRGLLSATLLAEDRSKHAATVGQFSFWLLKITQTNASDVRFVMDTLEGNGMQDTGVEIMKGLDEKLPGDLRPTFVKWLFDLGDYPTFAKEIGKLEKPLADYPELGIYSDAWEAGWGDDAGTSLEAKERLEAAVAADPVPGNLRVRMAVASKRRDLPGFEASIAELADLGDDEPRDHIALWKLMSAVGRRDDARGLAENYPFPPLTIRDVLMFADVYAELGMREEALDMLENNLPKYGYSNAVWMRNADLLIQQEKWEDLITLAGKMRRDVAVNRELEGFSYYLQGLADFQLGRKETASDSFEQAVTSSYPAPWLALNVGTSLSRLGFSELAKDLLLTVESDFKTNRGYWEVMFIVANDLKDITIALTASKAVYELNPDDRASINNYAAALIVMRQDPQTAVALTMKLSNWFPESAIVRINHSLALLLNHRDAEAKALLAEMNPMTMSSVVSSSYYQAMFEILLNEGRTEEAKEAAAKVDRRFLYPVEIEWLDQKLSKL